MEKEFEELLKNLTQKLKDTTGPINSIAENALRSAEKGEALGAEIKAEADKLLKQQGELTEVQGKLTDRLENLESDNNDLKQELAARGAGGSLGGVLSLGQQFVATDDVKAFMETGSGKASATLSNAITSVSAPALPDQERDVVGIPKKILRIRSLLARNTTASNAVKYRQQTVRTNNAAGRAEGAASAESALVWVNKDTVVRTISHHINVSKESYSDTDFLSGEIDNELVYGLALKEDLQLLSGDGVGENLSGLVANATAYAAAFTPEELTMLDTIRLALLQASLADYPADGVIMHPTDFAWVELLKDANNGYIFTNPTSSTAPKLWGRPIVETVAIDEDKFLAGSFRSAATIYDRKDTEVTISSEHGTNFVEGMLTILAEERLALAVKRPAALIYGDLGRVT